MTLTLFNESKNLEVDVRRKSSEKFFAIGKWTQTLLSLRVSNALIHIKRLSVRVCLCISSPSDSGDYFI